MNKYVSSTGFRYKTSANMHPHIELVLNGEYDIPILNAGGQRLVILDVGANIGAYSYWAGKRFPGCKIFAYEPSPTNATAYKKHIKDSLPELDYKLTVAAITSKAAGTVTLYKGSQNCGMHSISKELAGQSAETFEVQALNPKLLPHANILKADTEGCELDIIQNYLKSVCEPEIISFEFHSVADRRQLMLLLESGHNYQLCSGRVLHPSLGTLNFLRGDLFGKKAS